MRLHIKCVPMWVLTCVLMWVLICALMWVLVCVLVCVLMWVICYIGGQESEGTGGCEAVTEAAKQCVLVEALICVFTSAICVLVEVLICVLTWAIYIIQYCIGGEEQEDTGDTYIHTYIHTHTHAYIHTYKQHIIQYGIGGEEQEDTRGCAPSKAAAAQPTAGNRTHSIV